MKIYASDGTVLLQITALERSGSTLLIKGTMMGALPLRAELRPAELRKGFALLSWRMVLFLFSLLLRAALGTGSGTNTSPGSSSY